MGDLIQSKFYDLFDRVAKKPGGYGVMGVVSRALQNVRDKLDGDFIAQRILPEFYPAAPLPVATMLPSVCFKLSDYFMIDPDPNGNFALYFDPTATRPRSVETGLSDQGVVPEMLGVWNTDVSETGWGDFDHVSWISLPERIADYYDQYRLTGAVISLEYTGTIQEHSGYIVAGYFPLFKTSYCNLNTLRKAEFVQEVHPMEGIRCVWFPKDPHDDELKYPGNLGVPGDLQKALTLMYMGLKNSTGGFGTAIDKGSLDATGLTVNAVTAPLAEIRKPFNEFQPEVIMIYGTGLPTTTGNKFRGKIVRNFEGIPRPEAVDYVGAHNHRISPETLDTLAALGERMPELMTMPLEVTATTKAILDGKYSYMNDLLGNMRDYGNTLTANGASFRRGTGTASDFVNFLSKSLV